MFGMQSVFLAIVVLFFTVVPLLLILVGSVDLYNITKRSSALLMLFGAVLVGLGALDFLLNIVLLQFLGIKTYAQILIWKSYVMTAINFVGYLLIGLGIYFHAQELKQADKS